MRQTARGESTESAGHAAASTVKRSQTRNPKLTTMSHAELDFENKRYVHVQKSEPGRYTSLLPKYKDAQSPADPSKPMFIVKADGEKSAKDRALAGGEDMVLLECSKEDSDYVRQFGHPALSSPGSPATGWEDALANERTVEPDTGESFETIAGGVLAAS